MHCRRYQNIHCLQNSRFVPCAFRPRCGERTTAPHTHLLCSFRGRMVYRHSLFSFLLITAFFEDIDWRCSVQNPRLHRIDCEEAGFEVTLLRKTNTVHKDWLKNALLWEWMGGGDEEEQRNRWRHSASLLKWSLITVEAEAVIMQPERDTEAGTGHLSWCRGSGQWLLHLSVTGYGYHVCGYSAPLSPRLVVLS